ncbi:LysE family translocator [Roseivivax sediminis]|uniref:Threonine/homoserine/homoserine lactone efflux protein n=1 Tax=Roseivivax sediminis TaxID=936889 RepID=A0A1I1UC85_9RHOB|nr:LysE family translocator [Roseivivax sediminis]SFD67178.1 Threonine/homoserine/homoserine lactone efflux protein [Roseivivax sediminis]
MTVTVSALALYAGALLILFLTPGPVWVAMIARTLTGGLAAAWPLALGVVVGDVVWPFLAILGVAWIVEQYDGAMTVLRWVAAATFIAMGVMILRKAGDTIGADSRLTRPGAAAGFVAGLAAILGNPKAILFYMGMLPGFFDLGALTRADITAIVTLSAIMPLVGNLVLAVSVDRARRLLASPRAVRRMNRGAGIALILVGLVIPLA